MDSPTHLEKEWLYLRNESIRKEVFADQKRLGKMIFLKSCMSYKLFLFVTILLLLQYRIHYPGFPYPEHSENRNANR